ncbi:MAG: lamin tail domain-containing protein, partial [Caldilineaceae bacterium]|nr:lamin tail domain-containing protein [Caldilineaceae bacterium]
ASLERTGFGNGAGWATAWQTWPGSAGDLGTPGGAYVANPNPGPTDTPGDPGDPGVPPITGPLPRIRISEFMANPAAVNDSEGEWIELFNADSAAVNLRGWRIADLGSDGHTITDDLIIQPGTYLILGRNDARSENGGVPVAYVYASVSLSNGEDELLLIAPGDREADRVVWGDGALATSSGTSLERTGFSDGAGWATAWQAWPGSAGDLGTPGDAYVANPNPEPTNEPGPTATLPPDATPVPPITGEPPRLFISEFLANPAAVSDSAGEWIELYNDDNIAVNLRGWRIADADDDSHTIEQDLYILPTQYLILARNNDAATNGGVTVAYVYSGVSLANSEDELLLIGPGDVLVDEVRWGDAQAQSVTAGASLERIGFQTDRGWATAWQIWPGSAGDLGTPGSRYLPSDNEPPTVAPTATITATVTPPPNTGDLSRLFISEFLANPAAVGDSDGEWIEIYNDGDAAVNLRGWQISDLGNDSHIIAQDVIAEPGAYVVLGRNGDAAGNGGAPVDYVYSGLSLANGEDELLLLAPDGREADRVVWGVGALSTTSGASLQRALPDHPEQWFTSTAPWPGSAGDLGSPGAGPGAIPTPGPTPPGGTPAPTPGGDAPWPLALESGPLLLDEIAFRGSDGEFVTIRNAGEAPLALAGWSIGDAERRGDGEGMYALPDGAVLEPGALFVIARDGSVFQRQFGRGPDAQFEEADNGIMTLVRRRDLAAGRWALSDGGDEVALVNPAGEVVDAAVYGNGDYAALGRSGELRPPGDFSIQHVMGTDPAPGQDQRRRFLFASPAPFEVRSLPAGASANTVVLDDGYRAVWGTLGGQSNFTAGFTAPPRYLAAAARAAGLDFLALADDGVVTNPGEDFGLTIFSAWRWEDEEGNAAVIFSFRSAELGSVTALQAWLAEQNAFALWLTGDPPADSRIRAIDGSAAAAPGSLTPLLEAWQKSPHPLLPAGINNPPLPGRTSPAPRYTGLAVAGDGDSARLDALIRARGWLSSERSLYLTLRAESGDGEVTWMGGEMNPAGNVVFHVYYGDASGEPAGLALWRNDQPWQQLDLPPADGRWSVTVPALPGSRYFVVATQTDGDFAVTAPIYVSGNSGAGNVRIEEVVFSPVNDHNGDGEHNDDDEFVELLNVGNAPVDLAGWQLANRWSDESSSRRFTFREGAYLAAGERLVLWHSDLRFYLEDEHDYVRLLTPDGGEADRVEWGGWNGGSIGRDDEGDWQGNAVVTPNDDYNGQYGTGTPVETIVDPGAGQAGGPPGSLAQSKRLGLWRNVEFDAIVTVPPGLFNSAIYVADAAPDGVTSGLGIQVYLRQGEFPPLAEGDRVRIRGWMTTFRGEMEVALDGPEQIWPMKNGAPLRPLKISIQEVGESLEGRLVAFEGVVTGYQGDSIYLADPLTPEAEPVRVTVRSSLAWRRPYVNEGERFAVIGVVGQFALEKPWNGGYRVLVRYPDDLAEQ